MLFFCSAKVHFGATALENLLQDKEGTAPRRKGYEARLLFFRRQIRKIAGPGNRQFFTVEQYYGRAHGFGAERIAHSLLGKFHQSIPGQGIINDEIYDPRLSIPAGMAIDMSPFPVGIPTVIHGGSHQAIPKKNGKIVGPGPKAARLQEAIVR